MTGRIAVVLAALLVCRRGCPGMSEAQPGSWQAHSRPGLPRAVLDGTTDWKEATQFFGGAWWIDYNQKRVTDPMATLIQTDGTRREVAPENSTGFTG